MLLGLVDDLRRFADVHQPRETEGATRHVLNQTLDARLIARRQKHRLINAETAVLPSPHVLDHFRLDLLRGQVQFEDRFLPGNQQPLLVELGQLQNITLGGKPAAGDQHVDVGMPVQQFAMCLNRRDHDGHYILPPEQSPSFRLEARPGKRREFPQ